SRPPGLARGRCRGSGGTGFPRGGTPLSAVTAPTEPASATAPVVARPAPSGRLGPRWLNYAMMLFGPPAQRRPGRAALPVDRVRHWENEYIALSDADLRQRGLQLRGRARGGASLDRLLPEAFGLVSVAAQRVLKMRPFDVQLAAGVVLH